MEAIVYMYLTYSDQGRAWTRNLRISGLAPNYSATLLS